MQFSSLLLVAPNTRSRPAPAQLPSKPLLGPAKNVSSVPAGSCAKFEREITPPASPPEIPNQSFPRPSPAWRFPSIPNPAIVPITAAGNVPGGQPVSADGGPAQTPPNAAATTPH